MISTIIKNYLEKSGETQANVASRLGVSDRYFADVKNGKKPPSLAFGLKTISEFAKGSVELKQRWINLHAAYNGNKEVLRFLEDKYMSERQDQVSREVSYKLAGDIGVLFNAFSDILDAGEQGVSKGVLLETYGLSILKKLKFLEDKGIILINGKKYFIKNPSYLNHFPGSSFKMMIGLIRHEEDLWESGENEGVTRWSTWDIDEDKLKDYLNLVRKQHKEQQEFLQKNAKSTNKGGIRVGSFIGLTVLKRMFFLTCFTTLLFLGKIELHAGGQGGGTDPGGYGPVMMMNLNTTDIPQMCKEKNCPPQREFSTNLDDEDMNLFNWSLISDLFKDLLKKTVSI